MLDAWDARRSTERLWAKDATLWTNSGEGAWLGWLDAVAPGGPALDAFARRVEAATPAICRDVLLIGMGGSSLAPEVIARTARTDGNGRTLRVLDSTHPTAVLDAFASTDWQRTMIVVASKSGSTLEPDILLAAALERARAQRGAGAPAHVIAITDPGSKLASQAAALGFADVFLSDRTIGGRYSALSPFGLVHVAQRGIPLGTFMESACDMARLCKAPARENPGVQLGAFMASAARTGRDKCTLVLPRSFAALGAWIEQLVAESTGKNGTAILPIDGEPLAEPGVYGVDRAFIHVRDLSESAGNAPDGIVRRMDTLAGAGHPVFTIDVHSPSALAGEFFRWEFATAVAGALLGVNPFDQPDVEASKIATRALIDASERGEAAAADVRDGGTLRDLVASIKPGDYVALLAFLPMFDDVVTALQRTRMRVRDGKRVATSLGFGPRFLHSTGQAFKGGPNTGVFVQLTSDAARDLDVPGRRLTFGAVVAAQAAGDLAVLRGRGRRVMHVHLRGELLAALEEFDRDVAAALR
jgi:transaldolase/glucose-6-phosphate isomerase